MKALVAIANYGTGNQEYLQRLIREYGSMSLDVDVVVLSNIPKELGPDIEVKVGLPSKNPWSLPFAHRSLFSDRADAYDLFIYSEDDTLITEKNITAFIKTTEILPENEIAGFIRYEVNGSGNKFYSTVHSHFHWTPSSVKKAGDDLFAFFTNLHSASYILTRDQLKKAIESGGYLVEPHEGPYDLLCAAATDPYTQCGFKKLICISRLEDFEIHHLPNKYIGEMGIEAREMDQQIEVLKEVLDGKCGADQLINTDLTDCPPWEKKYFEKYRQDIVALVPEECSEVLSIGCGWGETEKRLIDSGKNVTAIPLDNVIARSAQKRGIHTTSPDIDKAYNTIKDKNFDCIIFSDILHYLKGFEEVTNSFSKLLSSDSIMIISLPNTNLIRLLKDAIKSKGSMVSENLKLYSRVRSVKRFIKKTFPGIRCHYKDRERYNSMKRYLSDSLILYFSK
jgi:2-polyprenyl-3-methyl-5-hydroxy-6-metoxy-1,4-benzoquinol methylase